MHLVFLYFSEGVYFPIVIVVPHLGLPRQGTVLVCVQVRIKDFEFSASKSTTVPPIFR